MLGVYYIIVSFFILNSCYCMRESDVYCNKVLRRPSFKQDLVLNKVWKVYFIWESLNHIMCLHIEFKHGSKKMVEEIRNNTESKLAIQPDWQANSILMYMGKQYNEYLLFADKVPGKFVGYPTQIHGDELDPLKKKNFLVRFHMKLLYHGQYLLISQCESGITVLASHKDPPPTRKEIHRLVAPMNYGQLYSSCFM